MTHNDIYTKFMIEYDKANVTSSYPSLTEYEVATVLDKAYLALIAQKVTGNNPRRSPFEADVKSIADIQPLVIHTEQMLYKDNHAPAANITQFKLPENCLYIVQTMLNALLNKPGDSDNEHLKEETVYSPQDIEFQQLDGGENPWVLHNETYHDNPSAAYIENSEVYGDTNTPNTVTGGDSAEGTMSKIKGNPMDKQFFRYLPVRLVNHDVAEKFFLTPYNMPWIKIPVGYVENNIMYIVYDSINIPLVQDGGSVHFTYIRKPNVFAKDLSKYSTTLSISYFECPANASDEVKADYEFECNSTIAEEMINLAISFALENVESQRLNSKLNMRGLEA